jgi:hypothetical protein
VAVAHEVRPAHAVDTTPTLSSLSSSGVRAGDCPADNSIAAGIWAHYRMGADAL